MICHAITSNNETLQRRLMILRENQGNSGSISKLTKEIIKLADTYKVPELTFDEQAARRCFNFQTWIMKLKPILTMFSQTAKVLPTDTVVPFDDPHHIGNRVLYLLICSRVDAYFQHQHRGNHNHHGSNRRPSSHGLQNKPHHNRRPAHQQNTSAAHAAQNTNIVCFNCGEPGHIAPRHPKGITKGDPHSIKPSARGHSVTGTTSNTDSSNEIVCMARVRPDM
jgi:hypothetical protein